MSDSFFVDTNVLVYVRDPADRAKQARAKAWLQHLWNDRVGRLSTQVLHEYYSVVTRKLKPGMAASAARDEIRSLEAWKPLVITSSTVEQAWALEDRFLLSWWDALILSAAQLARCRYLLSEDFQDGMEFDKVTVVNPFLHAP